MSTLENITKEQENAPLKDQSEKEQKDSSTEHASENGSENDESTHVKNRVSELEMKLSERGRELKKLREELYELKSIKEKIENEKLTEEERRAKAMAEAEAKIAEAEAKEKKLELETLKVKLVSEEEELPQMRRLLRFINGETTDDVLNSYKELKKRVLSIASDLSKTSKQQGFGITSQLQNNKQQQNQYEEMKKKGDVLGMLKAII